MRGVLKALETASVRAEAWIDPDTDDVVVRTSNEARVKELVASGALKLPADTVIEAGPFSRPTAATVPSGQFPPKSTDSIGPGFYYYNRYTDNADVRQCTFGFKASYQGRQGLLTAGHCESRGGEYTDAMVRGTGYWHWSGRWVEMYAPTLEYSTVYTRGGTGDKYDFQFHPTPGFTTQSDVFVGGSNYLKVINMDDSTWAGAGDLFCKYGSITGYMCGVLKNANHYWTGDQSYGYWRFRGNNNEPTSTVVGDSGGPVFSEPYNGEVWASALQVGVVTVSEVINGVSRPFQDSVQMPIDYIDDNQAVTLVY